MMPALIGEIICSFQSLLSGNSRYCTVNDFAIGVDNKCLANITGVRQLLNFIYSIIIIDFMVIQMFRRNLAFFSISNELG